MKVNMLTLVQNWISDLIVHACVWNTNDGASISKIAGDAHDARPYADAPMCESWN